MFSSIVSPQCVFLAFFAPMVFPQFLNCFSPYLWVFLGVSPTGFTQGFFSDGFSPACFPLWISPFDFFHIFPDSFSPIGFIQRVTKRCRLQWLTYSALVYEPKCVGGGVLRSLREWVQLCSWSPNKLWRSNSIFKGTGSPNGLIYFLYVWVAIGLNKRRGWFF